MKIEYTETFPDYSKADFEAMAAEEGMTVEEYIKLLDERIEKMKIKKPE